MSIRRIAECDVCETFLVESVSNGGWKGWCIINGIAMEDPEGTLTDKNTQTMLCCDCKEKVAGFLESLKEAEVK